MNAVIKPPIAEFYGIEIVQRGDVFVATVVGKDFPLGVADTPSEALYDLCEVIAEWGLEGEARDYPPRWWKLLWWEIGNSWRGMTKSRTK